MRSARAADWQRRLRTRQGDWPRRLIRFSFENIPSLGSAEISFSSPLTVLAGPNGVGKTTLLRSIWAALDPEGASSAVSADGRLSAGSSLITLLEGEEEVTGEVEFTPGACRVIQQLELPVLHIDSSAETRLHQANFAKFETTEELINGVGWRDLDEADIGEISFIAKRDYRSVRLYEVEMDGTVPFFEVAHHDDRYDSRTMGSGEISLFYLWWRIKTVEESAVVLLEEPEAFISSACQSAFANFLIKEIVNRTLSAVISTHSSAFISGVHKEGLQFLSRGAAGVEVLPERAPPILLKSMGIAPALSSIIFVEDHAAAAFCKAMLEKLDASLSRRVRIDVRNGDGEIVRALNLTKTFKVPLKFIGVFDGDLRGKVPEGIAGASSFLPGSEPMEVLFRRMVTANPGPLADATGKVDLGVILAGLEGADHHDWYEEIGRELGLNKDQLFPLLFSIWIQPEENQNAAMAAYEAISRLIDGEE